MDVNRSESVPMERIGAISRIEQQEIYKRIFVDAFTALTAACTVSPLVAAVDKYVGLCAW